MFPSFSFSRSPVYFPQLGAPHRLWEGFLKSSALRAFPHHEILKCSCQTPNGAKSSLKLMVMLLPSRLVQFPQTLPCRFPTGNTRLQSLPSRTWPSPAMVQQMFVQIHTNPWRGVAGERLCRQELGVLVSWSQQGWNHSLASTGGLAT